MEYQQKLRNYIYAQMQSGVQPAEIAQQLRASGWEEADITQGFQAVQQLVTPAAPASATPAEPATSGEPAAASPVVYEATGRRRGRIKTSWLLLKQSLKVLNTNKGLLRYPLFGMVLSFVLSGPFLAIIFLSGDTFVLHGFNIYGEQEIYFTPAGYALGFVWYVVTFFVAHLFNAALAAHTLDIFRGQSASGGTYIGRAWAKKGPLFVFAVISATVGIILQMIEERFQWLGFIVARFIGAVWSLATLFTLPIIMETGNNAPQAIKQSAQLFKSRWGENIISSVGLGAIMVVISLIVMIPLFFLLVMVVAAFDPGPAGIIFVIAAMLLIAFMLGIISGAASSVLSTALYYYAQYQHIPAAFDRDLLQASLIPRKR